jgi:hypothetical protein
MKYELKSVEKSDKNKKRLKAIFVSNKNTTKVVHFGSDDGTTYLDKANDEKRANYIARHQVNENWSDPTNSGTLARYILWEYKDLNKAIREYKKRFNV